MRTWATRAPRLLRGPRLARCRRTLCVPIRKRARCTWVTWRLAVALPWWCSPCSTPRPMTRRPTSRRSSSWPMPAARSCAWPSRAAAAWTRSRPCARNRPCPSWPTCTSTQRIAIEAARRGAAKLRINPGNIGGLAKTDAVHRRRRAGRHPHPHRRERRARSTQALAARDDLTLPEKLAASARQLCANTAKAAAFTTWWSARRPTTS